MARDRPSPYGNPGRFFPQRKGESKPVPRERYIPKRRYETLNPPLRPGHRRKDHRRGGGGVPDSRFDDVPAL